MKLYRIDEGTTDATLRIRKELTEAVVWGLLVEVVPCEHGNYAEHVDDDKISVLYEDRIEVVWCDGAGLDDPQGDTNEETKQ